MVTLLIFPILSDRPEHSLVCAQLYWLQISVIELTTVAFIFLQDYILYKSAH